MTPFWGTHQREELLQHDPELGDSNNLTEASLSLLKVDDIPDRREVVGLDVFVLEVESVLPDVDTNDRDVREQRILIRRGDNLEHLRPRVIPEPAPPAALNPSRARIELRLERIDRAKVALERSLQLAVFEPAAALLRGSEVLPEERVVDVASAIELERGLERDLFARRRRLDVRLFCCIETVHVGLVVLFVMELHDFG